MKDHDVLFHLFFFPQIFSDAPSVKEVIGIYLWDLQEPLLGVFLAQISRNGERKEENMESCSMTWKIS